MAPKEKKKKKKSKKVIDPEQEAAEAKRKEFIQKAQNLTNEIANDERTKREFSARLDQTKIFWDFEKKNVEVKKRRLKLKEDELKSISEFHLSEIESIKDHIKYLLYQQQNESTNLKNNAQVQLFSVQDEYAKGIDKKNTDVTEYQSLIKEAEVSHNNFMVCLHRDYDSRVDKMCEEFKRRFHIITAESEKIVKTIREEQDAKMQHDVKHLEEEKEKQAKIIEKKYEDRLNELRSHYNKSLHKELDKIQDLKTELLSKRKLLAKVEKICRELESKHKSIVGPFARAKENLEVLGKDSKEFHEEKKLLETKKRELKIEENALKGLEWRHEVLFQKFELLERQYHSAQAIFDDSMLVKCQRYKMNDMILKKKTSTMYDLARNHMIVLIDMLENDPTKEETITKEHCKKQFDEQDITIENLDKIQAEMQRMHNAFLAGKLLINV